MNQENNSKSNIKIKRQTFPKIYGLKTASIFIRIDMIAILAKIIRYTHAIPTRIQ